MATDLAADKQRVYAVAGVGGLAGGRWHDVPLTHPVLEGWVAAGLVQRTGPHGEPAPERMPLSCCGARR